MSFGAKGDDEMMGGLIRIFNCMKKWTKVREAFEWNTHEKEETRWVIFGVVTKTW